MRNREFYQGVFIVAAWYDFILGAAFFLFYPSIYALFTVQLPENPGYLHLAAAFVFVQGIGYYFVYRNMERNFDIVKIGAIYKAAYTAVAFYYWAVGQLPHPLFAAFGAIDLIFLLLFVLYLRGATAAKA